MPAAYRGAILTATITGLVCMGDTILYSVLPVYADSIGLSDFWVGFLLSINRFVRLVSHGIIASFIIRVGVKKVVLISSIGAALSTFLYKSPALIFLFVGARVIWGIAYSGFRQAILFYAANASKKRSQSFALSHVIKSIGPFLILLTGPIIFEEIGYEKSFILIGSISVIGTIIAFLLPEIKIHAEEYNYKNVLLISWFKVLLFLASFIVDGFIVVVLSILFSKQSLSSPSLLIMVSFYLLTKRMISFLLPIVFIKSYSLFSITRHYNLGISTIILGLVILSQQLYASGLIILFIGATVTENVAPLKGLQKKGSQKMEVITAVTLWWDVGKALGSLVGILVYKNLGGDIIFLTLGIFMTIIFIILHIPSKKNASREHYV